MVLATGIFKKLVIAPEVTWGTSPGPTGGQYLRRVQSTLDLRKATFQSNEIRATQQVSDFRHGVRTVEGSIDGELSPGTYSQLMQAVVRRDFTSGATVTSTGISSTSSPKKIIRATGSWITDGYKLGDIVRASGFTATANNAKNFRILALTATDMTVDLAITAESAGNSITVAVYGKKTWVPTSGHTDQSFTIEHFYDDIDQSELFLGCKPTQMDIGLPPNNIATARFNMMGKDMSTGTTAHFTSPSASSAGRVLAAVNGSLRIGSDDIAVVTGAQFTINGNFSAEPVVGSNVMPHIFAGRVIGNGQFTAFFEGNATLRDAFLNEDELSLQIALTSSNAADADFVSFVMPRIKLGGSSKNDGEKGLIMSIPFVALENSAGGTGTTSELTTISIQDSLAA